MITYAVKFRIKGGGRVEYRPTTGLGALAAINTAMITHVKAGHRPSDVTEVQAVEHDCAALPS